MAQIRYFNEILSLKKEDFTKEPDKYTVYIRKNLPDLTEILNHDLRHAITISDINKTKSISHILNIKSDTTNAISSLGSNERLGIFPTFALTDGRGNIVEIVLHIIKAFEQSKEYDSYTLFIVQNKNKRQIDVNEPIDPTDELPDRFKKITDIMEEGKFAFETNNIRISGFIQTMTEVVIIGEPYFKGIIIQIPKNTKIFEKINNKTLKFDDIIELLNKTSKDEDDSRKDKREEELHDKRDRRDGRRDGRRDDGDDRRDDRIRIRDGGKKFKNKKTKKFKSKTKKLKNKTKKTRKLKVKQKRNRK